MSTFEQKPCDMGQMCLDCQPRGANGECPDQTPKQKRLTDVQICEMADATPVDEISCAADTWHIRFARVIEAAHGIKE